jgi:hypothetical protein
MAHATVTSTQSKFYFGTLSEQGNYGSYADGTHHTNIGPCIVEIRRIQYAQYSPSYYVYIDGLHQCGGRDFPDYTFDRIAADLPWHLVAIEPVPAVVEGNVVEFFDSATDSAGGLVDNLPQVRRIARVSHFRPDGTVCLYDPEGARAIRHPEALTVIAERTEAGWGNLA